MELNSPIYLLFLLAAVSVAAFTRRPAGRMMLFLALSYCFYVSWSSVFVFLLAGSSLVNFAMGRLLFRNRRPGVLCLGIGVNILILCVGRSAASFLAGWFNRTPLPASWWLSESPFIHFRLWVTWLTFIAASTRSRRFWNFWSSCLSGRLFCPARSAGCPKCFPSSGNRMQRRTMDPKGSSGSFWGCS